jgi:hypothetical protein
MKNRLLLAAVVVILLTLGVFLLVPGRRETTTEYTRPTPLAKIDTGAVTKIVLEHVVGEGDKAAKQRVVLIRGEGEGDSEPTWSLDEPVKAAANKTSVDTLLKRLEELEVTDVATESAGSHADLEVTAEKGITVEVYAGSSRVASFILGKYASGSTMLRLPEQDVVYRTRGSLRYAFGKSASDWRDKTIFDFDREQISHIAFQNENGTFAFARDSASKNVDWTIESVDAVAPAHEEADEEGDGGPSKATDGGPSKAAPTKVEPPARVTTIEGFDPAKVTGIVTTLAKLKATDFLDRAEGVDTGLDAPTAPRVTFKVGTGDAAKTYTIIVGREAEERSAYARRSDQDQIFLLTKYMSDRLSPGVENFQKRAPAKAGGTASGPEPDLDALGGGLGGGNKLPPELMKQLQQQMLQQKMMEQLSKQGGGPPPR